MSGIRLSEKDPAAEWVLVYEFERVLQDGQTINSIVSATCVVERTERGATVDASPATVISSSAISGTTVLVKAVGGVTGNDYEIRVTIDAVNPVERHVLVATLPVRTA